MSATAPSSASLAQWWTHFLRSPRASLVLRRLAAVVPIMFGVTLLTFFILNVLPGDAARQLLGPDASPEQVEQLRQELRLDRPAAERYIEWLTAAASGDLGVSLASRQPVSALIAERIPVTLELVAYSLLIALGSAVPIALLAARWPGGILDRVVLVLSMTGLSTASFVLALLLVLVFSVQLGWLPSMGFVPIESGLWHNIRSLTLPALSITIPLSCLYVRMLRSDLLDQMAREDYVVAAYAKGLGPWRVLIHHALRNSLFGLLTVVGLNVGAIVGGTVIIEQIFAVPGVGHLLLQAINTRDAPVVQGVVLLLTAVTVLTNLIVDLLYLALDPRVRHGRD